MVHDKSQLYPWDDSSLLRCPKHLFFLPIDPPWHLSVNFECSLCTGHLLTRTPPLCGRRSAVNRANVLTPARCLSRAGTHITVVYKNSRSALLSSAGAGGVGLLKAKSHAVSPLLVPRLSPQSCCARIPELDPQHQPLLARPCDLAESLKFTVTEFPHL